MIRVYTAPDMFWLQHARNQLDFAGIETFVRNEYAGGALGDLSFIDCWPELWVADQVSYQKASKILADLNDEKHSDGPEHNCTMCAASNPSNFERCWQCQSPLDTPPAD
ncbi:DUF2007 domain-containing protein [Simiduia aestuariiviva]|uniref:DUF2007 domain-containing protein n=1 Tax=Simiduia aestuariiviva TaxID=1510459 RepID=A0A839UVA0_9GAMM|nr:DUF2007 domain-containing protein [Simiduia aestuariiviva]MBB3169398.1 hypothetical protein [Simiduia aestuariiviva]